MRKIAGYLTKNRSGKDQKIAQSTHENEYIKPRKTFWRNSKQFLNRFRYGVANSGEGFPLKAIFAGKVEFSGGVPRITKQKRYNQYWYGAENKKCQLSYMTNAPRYCTISFPSGTFSSADKYTVLLSGELLRSDNGPGVYASVIKRTANSFTVYTGDDASWNDGNFTFIVIATHLWE